LAIKNRVRAASPTLMCDAQVENQGNRPRSVSQVGGKRNVSTPLTPAYSHLLCLYFVGCAKKVSEVLNRPVIGLQSSYAFARSSASSALPRTPSCGQRWETSSLRRRLEGVFWYKQMACLGSLRPQHRDEAWSASLRQTFFSLAVGAQIPAIAALPSSTCDYKRFALDALGDHVGTCTGR
jgi:hypothetical protein